jgi:RNA polymerase sigma-70 factor (ECF subfamily)
MDRDLIARARDGDRDAFERIAASVISRLDATARLIVRDREQAQDAVQECLVRAWRDLPRLRDVDRFDPWLRRLLVRACVDELRRFRRRSVEVDLAVSEHPVVSDGSVAFADREALDRAFRRLAPDQRALVVLHYYLDLPLSEAADALRVPVGTAKSRLHRGREALRAAIEADARSGRVFKEGQLA